MPDVLMLPLATAAQILMDAKVDFCVVETKPCSNKFLLVNDCHYVLRQTLIAGKCRLVVAAKMGKEV